MSIMPRTKLDIPDHRELRVLLGGTMRTEGATMERVGRILNCSPSTAQRRMKDPGSLTLDELARLGRGLHIPIDELRSAALRY